MGVIGSDTFYSELLFVSIVTYLYKVATRK